MVLIQFVVGTTDDEGKQEIVKLIFFGRGGVVCLGAAKRKMRVYKESHRLDVNEEPKSCSVRVNCAKENGPKKNLELIFSAPFRGSPSVFHFALPGPFFGFKGFHFQGRRAIIIVFFCCFSFLYFFFFCACVSATERRDESVSSSFSLSLSLSLSLCSFFFRSPPQSTPFNTADVERKKLAV